MTSFCFGCGKSMVEGERFCAQCGWDSQAVSAAPRIDPEVAFGLLPVTSGKAIFSLIAGILFFVLPFSIMAVIFGYLALSEIRKSPGKLKGRGLAITGIVLGYVGVAVIVGIIGLGIYSISNEIRHTENIVLSSAETSAVAAVRTLNTAEIAYAQAHRESGYTCSLSDLSGAWGISEDLAKGKKNDYLFELKNCTSAKPSGPIVKYQLVAYPLKAGTTAATPAFCSDQSDVIRVARNGSAQDCLKTGVDLSEKEVTHPQIWQ